jgi:hypothetical protein
MFELIEHDLLEEITERPADVMLPELKDKHNWRQGQGVIDRSDHLVAIANSDSNMAEILLLGENDPNFESLDGTIAIKVCWRTQDDPRDRIQKLSSILSRLRKDCIVILILS